MMAATNTRSLAIAAAANTAATAKAPERSFSYELPCPILSPYFWRKGGESTVVNGYTLPLPRGAFACAAFIFFRSRITVARSFSGIASTSLVRRGSFAKTSA